MPFININELTPQKTDYLWPGRLALGHLALFDGDPGLGKSLISMDLCARITTGQPFPDGSPGREPATVVIANAEDGARDTLHARLGAAGADLSRVVVWERRPGEAWLRFPDHLGQLDELVARTEARYVVLDPLFAFLDSTVQAGCDPSVRQALAPLADLAMRRRCAIHLVRHLNKRGTGSMMYRGLYSIAFIAACRLAWLAAPDPRQPRQFVLAQLKNNLDPPQPSLVYRIAPHESGTARIEWGGVSPWRDDDLAVRLGKRLRNRQRIHDFLADMLKDGPRTARDLWAAAKPLGLTPRMLRAARYGLGVRIVRANAFQPDQETWWLLRDQTLPEEVQDRSAHALDRLQRSIPDYTSNPLEDYC